MHDWHQLSQSSFLGEIFMRGLRLRNIPDDVFKILLAEQHQEKLRTGKGVFGIERTIYKIVKDWERCKKAEENKSK